MVIEMLEDIAKDGCNYKKYIEKAKDKILMGPERKSMVMPEEERRNTAYHESGHAIVATLLPGLDPVHKISIVQRGFGALGYTMQLPLEDRYLMQRHDLLHQLAVLLGGRSAGGDGEKDHVVFDRVENLVGEHAAVTIPDAVGLRELGAHLATLPEVTDYQAYAGTSAPINFNGLVRHYFLRRGASVADIQVNLRDKHERRAQSHDVAKRVRPAVAIALSTTFTCGPSIVRTCSSMSGRKSG